MSDIDPRAELTAPERAALDAWSRVSGDTTGMLYAVRHAIAALDLDARDARVRAESLCEAYPKVEIGLEELKQLFDLIVSSLDFGSGFLETDDVELLRRIAVKIGVDPMKATPEEFATQYPHPFKRGLVGPLCTLCRRREDVHQAVEAS